MQTTNSKNQSTSNFGKLAQHQIQKTQFVKGGGLWSGSLGIDNSDPKTEEKNP